MFDWIQNAPLPLAETNFYDNNNENKVVFRFEIFQKLFLTCYDKAIIRGLLFFSGFPQKWYSSQTLEESQIKSRLLRRHSQNRRVPGSSPSKYLAPSIKRRHKVFFNLKWQKWLILSECGCLLKVVQRSP